VPDERAHDREAIGLGGRLDGVRDVAEAVAGNALLNAAKQRPLSCLEQVRRQRADGADRQGAGGVGDPGIPCTIIELGEAQIEPGKPR
jgi:hypothetical protein